MIIGKKCRPLLGSFKKKREAELKSFPGYSDRHLEEQVIGEAKQHYHEVIKLGELANPAPTAETARPRRGRSKQSAARNLLDRFLKYEDAVLVS